MQPTSIERTPRASSAATSATAASRVGAARPSPAAL
jgi:hypothetical protein